MSSWEFVFPKNIYSPIFNYKLLFLFINILHNINMNTCFIYIKHHLHGAISSLRRLALAVSVCTIGAAFAQNPADQKTSFGTGFAVSESHILTAYHTVSGKEALWVGPVEGKWAKAQLIKSSTELDLALLSAEIHAKPLSIANWDDVPIGVEAFVIGYPQPTIQGLSKKITQGIVNGTRSDKESSPWSKLFQLSAEVNKGNSGGPVVAADGSVIGMVLKKVDALSFAEKSHDLTVNVNYGLKSKFLIDFLSNTAAQVQARPLALKTVLRPYQVFAQSEGSVYAVIGRSSKDEGLNAHKP
jgi:S1-C subfamily serine protease